MTWIIIAAISVLFNVVLILNIRNLIIRSETQEDLIQSLLKTFNDIDELSSAGYARMEELDELGAFKSDDQVGFFFENLKEVQQAIKDYKDQIVENPPPNLKIDD